MRNILFSLPEAWRLKNKIVIITMIPGQLCNPDILFRDQFNYMKSKFIRKYPASSGS